MRQLDPVALMPTRYQEPVTMIKDYRNWFLGNVTRKTEFSDRVEFLRTAAIGRFYLFWMLCDYFEDFKIIQSGKQRLTTVQLD